LKESEALNSNLKTDNTNPLNGSEVGVAEKLDNSDNMNESIPIIATEGLEKENDKTSNDLTDELLKDTEELTPKEKKVSIEELNNNVVVDIKKDSAADVSKAESVGIEVKKSKERSDLKKWNVSVFAGPTLINKTISGNEESAYYTKRKEGEESILSLNYGVDVGYFFNVNMNISSGINKLTYGEDAKYSIEKIRSNTISVISSYDTINSLSYIDSLGVIVDTIITTTTSANYTDQTTSDTISNEFSIKNRYTYIQVPLMLGYKKQFNKIGVNVKAGIVYGRLIKSSGIYLTSNGNEIVPIDLKKNIFNVAFSTAVSYRVKKFSLFVEPKYQFNIRNVFPNAVTNQKYKAAGINFGIGLEF